MPLPVALAWPSQPSTCQRPAQPGTIHRLESQFACRTTTLPHPRMPTTIPIPADRGEHEFIAVDAVGREWRWDDAEMVWIAADASPSRNGRDQES